MTVIVEFGLLLLALLALHWYLFWFIPTPLPQHINVFIPGADSSPSLNLDGFILVAFIITDLIIAQKRILYHNPEADVKLLTISGMLIGLIALPTFHAIRLLFADIEGPANFLKPYLRSVFGVLIYTTIFSFMIAFQLKTRRTGMLFLLIVIFVILVNLAKRFYGSNKQELSNSTPAYSLANFLN